MKTAITSGGTINVEQASLKTATITIQALTVNKRQVTQAVFRQLLEEPVVDRGTGAFNGLPWGTVNYCPDKKACGRAHTHLHVVWQKDDGLRRAIEKPPARFEPWSEAADEWLWLALADGWSPTWVPDRDMPGGRCVHVKFVEGLPAVPCELPYDDSQRTDVEYAVGLKDVRPERDGPSQWDDEHREGEQAALNKGRALTDQLRGEATREERHAQVRTDIREQRRAHEECWARWRELQDLPQLFIAT